MPALYANTASRSGKTTPKIVKRGSEVSLPPAIVGQIYQAAFYPEAWTAVLSDTAALLDSTKAFFVLHDEQSDTRQVFQSHGVDAAFAAALEGRLAQDAPWLTPIESTYRRDGEVMFGDSLLRQAASGTPSLFQEFLRQQDVGPMLYSCLGALGHKQLHLIVARPAAAEAYSERDRGNCQALVDHIVGAWRLERRVAEDQLSGSVGWEALNRLEIGVAIVDSKGEVRMTNDAGSALLSGGDGLSFDFSQVDICVDGTRGSLRTMLGRLEWCRQTPGRDCTELFAVERPSRGRPYAILVQPYRPEGKFPVGDAFYNMVFIFDPDRPLSSHSVEFLKQHFELTPAEARLAKLIAEGERLDSIADRLGISVHTARTHLKRVFEKTGVERQAELVQLMFGCLGVMQDGVAALAVPSSAPAASVDSPAA